MQIHMALRQRGCSRRTRDLSHVSFIWATVCKTVCRVLSNRCLSVLSVTLVYCGQTVGWIKLKLGMAVGLSPGHIVLDGDQGYPKGAHPQFRPMSVVVKRLDGSRGRARPGPHCVRWGRSPLLPKGEQQPPSFRQMSICGQTIAHHLS